jgi:ABC-type Fe3+/spermidine/putrescine transport system ATPase subunit
MTKSDFFAAFRPKDVELTHKADLKGIITRVIFLGNIYEYRVKLGDTEIRVQQDSNSATQNEMFKENDICGVKLRNVRYYEDVERQ